MDRLVGVLRRIVGDEASDREQRSIGRIVLNDLRNHIEQNLDDIIQDGKDRTVLTSKSQMTKVPYFWSKDGTLVIPIANISEDYSDLLIILTGQRGHDGMGKLRNTGLSVMVLNNTLKGPFDGSYANTRLNQSKFYHEFIHYLDEKRTGEKEKSTEKYDAGRVEDYFNDPLEYNAYYQEALTSIENTLKNETFVEKIVQQGSRKEFFDFILGYFDKEFMDNLLPKYKRKLMKRLGRFYAEVVMPLQEK